MGEAQTIDKRWPRERRGWLEDPLRGLEEVFGILGRCLLQSDLPGALERVGLQQDDRPLLRPCQPLPAQLCQATLNLIQVNTHALIVSQRDGLMPSERVTPIKPRVP